MRCLGKQSYEQTAETTIKRNTDIIHERDRPLRRIPCDVTEMMANVSATLILLSGQTSIWHLQCSNQVQLNLFTPACTSHTYTQHRNVWKPHAVWCMKEPISRVIRHRPPCTLHMVLVGMPACQG